MSSADLPFFVYGTLRDMEVRTGVLGHPVSATPCVARGWQTVYYPGELYPALVTADDHSVEGLLLESLSEADQRRLDAFEGDQYRRDIMSVEGAVGTIAALAYFPTAQIAADAPEWRFADWRDRHRPSAITVYRATEFAGH